MYRTHWVALALSLVGAAGAHAFTISNTGGHGCHEDITAKALRTVRAELPTAPPIAPDRNGRALIADLPFALDDDLQEVAAASLLLAVRDNDIKGHSPTDSFDVVPINGDPALQREHCLRQPGQTEPGGSQAALGDCRAFILERLDQALDGLGPDGSVDAANTLVLPVYLLIRGSETLVTMPLFYVRIGQALHALEDGFPHALRDAADGTRVTMVLNWTQHSDRSLQEPLDGVPHMTALDRCEETDEPRARRRALAEAAATDFLRIALDPARSRADKLRDAGALFDVNFQYESGCTQADGYCEPAANALRDSGAFGCAVASGARSRGASLAIVAAIALALGLLRRRRKVLAMAIALAIGLLSTGAHAEEEVWLSARRPSRYGSPVGVQATVGAAADRPALSTALGLRLRLHPRFLLGLDAEWNPWLNGAREVKNGAVNAYVSGIVRYPIRNTRLALRQSVSVGASVLLFDLYGVQMGSVGLFVGTNLLGLDVAMPHHFRFILDPLGLAMPIPHLTAAPFYYLQYRLTVGISWGA